MELWAGCISGALEESDYRAKLASAGFGEIAIEPWRIYEAKDVGTFLSGSDLGPGVTAEEVGGKFASAAIRAVKPQSGALTPGRLPSSGSARRPRAALH